MTGGPALTKPVRKVKKPKRLKRQSAKRKAIAPVRAAFVAEMLAAHPWCQVCPRIKADGIAIDCTRRSTEVHEPLTRARAPGAETILDKANVFCCCSWGHFWIHTHPTTATRLGLLRSAGGNHV